MSKKNKTTRTMIAKVDPRDQEIRLLRHSLMALRERLCQDLDAFDQRLAALEPEEGIPSTQFPRTPEGWLEFLRS